MTKLQGWGEEKGGGVERMAVGIRRGEVPRLIPLAKL